MTPQEQAVLDEQDANEQRVISECETYRVPVTPEEIMDAAARRVAAAHNRVAELEDARALIKAGCIAEMIGKPNPLSDGKPHSASSAEKIVEEHIDYAAHRALQRAAEVERWRSLGAWHAALVRVRVNSGCTEAGD